jgi:hypothetical protein
MSIKTLLNSVKMDVKMDVVLGRFTAWFEATKTGPFGRS